MNITAYGRVSTEKEDHLNSLATQKNFFQEFSSKNCHNPVRLYADEGISGTKTKNRKQFLRVMADADVVRQIYRWYVTHGHGAARLSCMLNERGIKTKRGCQWPSNVVCRILENELYERRIS